MPSVYTDYQRYAAEKEYAIPLPQEREFHDRAIHIYDTLRGRHSNSPFGPTSFPDRRFCAGLLAVNNADNVVDPRHCRIRTDRFPPAGNL